MTDHKIFKQVVLGIVLLGYVLAAAMIVAQYPKQHQLGRALRLDRFRPSFDYLMQLSDGKIAVKSQEIMRYVQYYDYITQIKEADGAVTQVQAFCLFYLGRVKEAKALYAASVKEGAVSFWGHYNLAMLAFKEGHWQEAEENLTKALSIDTQAALMQVVTSKVYLQFIAANQLTPQDVFGRLQHGYGRALFFMQQLKRLDILPDQAKQALIADLSANAAPVLF